jgi:aminoglycoside phosphotransferase (APT) family kinase protein
VKPIPRAALDWLRDELAPRARVTRVRPMHGGVSCSVHEVWLESAAGTRQNVVVRRYGEDWHVDTWVCGREFKLLQVLTDRGFPAPRPLLLDNGAAVFGAPTLVMTRLPGRATLQPRNLPSYLEQLAEALASLHATPIEGLAFLPNQDARLQHSMDRGSASRDPLEHRVWEAVRALWPSVGKEQRLVHGDFWPGNTVWYRDRLSGVIDWEMAALGSSARDVATCRCDLTNLFDLATADAFTRFYERAVGAAVADLPFWDLLVSTGALRYIADWSRGYRDLGRIDLTRDAARQRVEGFARAALADAKH